MSMDQFVERLGGAKPRSDLARMRRREATGWHSFSITAGTALEIEHPREIKRCIMGRGVLISFMILAKGWNKSKQFLLETGLIEPLLEGLVSSTLAYQLHVGVFYHSRKGVCWFHPLSKTPRRNRCLLYRPPLNVILLLNP